MTNLIQRTEAERMIASGIQFGLVEEVDYAAAKARVRIGALLTGWLPIITTRAGGDRTWWPYEAGEQVVVLAPSGNIAAGVILGSLYTAAHAAPGDAATIHRTAYADGSVIEYDRAASHLKIHLGGGTAEIVAPGGIAVTGTIAVQGDVIADGISLKTHTHPHGDPAGDTGGPN